MTFVNLNFNRLAFPLFQGARIPIFAESAFLWAIPKIVFLENGSQTLTAHRQLKSPSRVRKDELAYLKIWQQKTPRRPKWVTRRGYVTIHFKSLATRESLK